MAGRPMATAGKARVMALLAFSVLGAGLALGVFVVALTHATAARADGSCTINWNGANTGGLWATAANWDLGRTPTTGDVVCVGSSVTGTVIFDGSNGTGNTSISELRSSAPLEVSGGLLGLSDAAATGNSVGGLVLSGGSLTGPGGLTDNGDFSWTGGGFDTPAGTMTQPAGHTANIAGGFANGWGLHFLGSLVSITQGWSLNSGATFTASGDVTVTDGSNVTTAGGPNLNFTVDGTLSKLAGSGTETINVPVTLNGQVAVDGGELNLAGGGTASGAMSVPAGTTLGLGAGLTLNSAATVSGAGTLTTLGSGGGAPSVTLNGDISVGSLTGSAFNNGSTVINGTLTVTGNLSMQGGVIALTSAATGNSVGGLVLSGGSLTGPGGLTDNGDFSWTGGGFDTPAGTMTQPAGHT